MTTISSNQTTTIEKYKCQIIDITQYKKKKHLMMRNFQYPHTNTSNVYESESAPQNWWTQCAGEVGIGWISIALSEEKIRNH